MIEKKIFIDFGNGFYDFLDYSLTNNIKEIEDIIGKWTKTVFYLNNVKWTFSNNLDENVKNVMNENKVNYSIAKYFYKPGINIIISVCL